MRYARVFGKVSLLTALSLVAFVACKKEKEQNGPSISIPSEPGIVTSDLTVAPGTYDFRFKFIAQKGSGKDDADLKTYSFSRNSGTGDIPYFSNRPVPNGASFTFDTTMSGINGVNGAVYTFTFSVTDKNSKTASKSIRIRFQSDTTTPPIVDSLINASYSSANNQGNHLHYNSNSGGLHVQSRTSADGKPSQILFVYFYSSSSGKHSVISPAILRDSIYDGTAVEWDNPNTQTTTFRSVSGSPNFSTITYQGIIDAYNNGTDINNEFPNNGNQRAECTAGRFIAFKQGNIYGLIRVDGVTPNGDGAVLSVKVARP